MAFCPVNSFTGQWNSCQSPDHCQKRMIKRGEGTYRSEAGES